MMHYLPAVLFVALLVMTGLLAGCVTRYNEFTGSCITQEWALGNLVLRTRQICELPPPGMGDEQLIDKEPVSPYPDFLDRDNKADSRHPDLLEKSSGYDPDNDPGKEDD